jgi:2-polyprenyl-3-methyl-5-hydroxy-6-metoxy-1,4-benzoquinol methylase
MLKFDFDLRAREQQQMQSIKAESWFTQVAFRNATSPRHPEADTLDPNHDLKRKLMLPWIKSKVKGKRVLDLFCANGAFSFEAAFAGAREVVGVEFSEDRVRCAQFIASVLPGKVDCAVPRFLTGDVYELKRTFQEPFDVVLALGGLYHVPDPPFVLTQIRCLTKEALIVQTASVLPGRANQAKFVVRKDLRDRGMTSVVGGRGAWHYTATCFENMLRHAGFKVLESARPSFWERRRFAWYCALADPV